MFCPQCKTEYREGFTECSDCGSQLVNQLPPDSAAETELPNAELISVQTFSNQVDAELAKGLLDAAGVESMLQSDDARGTQPALSLTRGIELLVRSEDADRAAEILATEIAAEDSEAEDAESET